MSPTVRELCGLLGIGGLNGVTCHLKALTKKGYISHRGGKARTIMPIGEERAVAVQGEDVVLDGSPLPWRMTRQEAVQLANKLMYT